MTIRHPGQVLLQETRAGIQEESDYTGISLDSKAQQRQLLAFYSYYSWITFALVPDAALKAAATKSSAVLTFFG